MTARLTMMMNELATSYKSRPSHFLRCLLLRRSLRSAPTPSTASPRKTLKSYHRPYSLQMLLYVILDIIIGVLIIVVIKGNGRRHRLLLLDPPFPSPLLPFRESSFDSLPFSGVWLSPSDKTVFSDTVTSFLFSTADIEASDAGDAESSKEIISIAR